MAYEIETLADRVTKRRKGTDIILYTFGAVARIRVNTRLNTVQFIEGNDPDREEIKFEKFTENFGTANAEEYADYIATAPDNFFFDPVGGGGAANVTLDYLFAETTNLQSPTFTRALGWVDVEFAANSGTNDTFELLPDNITFLNKKETVIQLSAKLKFERSNNNNRRSTPELRILWSADGLTFTPLVYTEANALIRSANVNIDKGTPVISAFGVNLPVDTQFRLQARITADNANVQDEFQNGYFNMLAYTQKSEITQAPPQILNPLGSVITIPASQLFTHNYQIINATSVTLENAPPEASIDLNGVLTILSPVENTYPLFKVVANNGTNLPAEDTTDLTIAGFQNTLRVQLNGVDQYLRTDDTITLDLQRSQGNSISFWIEFTGQNVNQIIDKYNYGIERGYWLKMDVDERLRWRFGATNTNYNEVKFDTVLQLNRLYHVLISWTGNNAADIELFLDGVLQTQRTIFSDTLSNGGDTRNGEPLYVGFNPNNGNTGDFLIDELCVWKSYKVPPTLAPELYNNGVPLNMDDFTGNQPSNWWRMGEGSAFPIIENEKSNTPSRTMLMVNGNNNIVPF